MRWYGYLGLLPFIVLSAFSLVEPGLGRAGDPSAPATVGPLVWRQAYDTYSAVILAFMAGIYWPLCLRGDSPAHGERLMSIAILIALLAWFALFLPPGLRALLFAGSFALLYLIDRFVLEDYWSAGYLQMRGHLTAVVVVTQGLLVLAADWT